MTRDLSTAARLQEYMQAEYPLSPQQFAAVTAPLAPAVVIAGAGSGKTTLMAARVVWLVGTGQVQPEEVLGLTFTTKAASELATRIRAALRDAGVLPPAGPPRVLDRGEEAPDVLEPTVATYNAYAAALLTEHGLRIGHEPDTRVIADASRYQLAARVIARHDREVAHLSDHPPTVINYLLALDSAMSEHLTSAEEVLALQEQLRPRVEEAIAVEHRVTALKAMNAVLHTFNRRVELLDLVASYRRLKSQLGLMEFSDQIELAARLARTRPEVGESERGKYKVVLLDEYQDTSVAQALMLSRLFSGPSAAAGRGHPVTAVGDPNQAIYGWRGASVSNILHFGEDFPSAAGETDVPSYPLTVNRRSDTRVLDVANELAGPLYRQFPMVQPLEAPPDSGQGEVHAAVFETYQAELAWLPDQVKGAHQRFGRWSEIGVLTRDNAHAADVFKALSEAEVPVEIVGLKGLLALPEVAEVVATLTLLHDLTANASLLTLLTGPRWAVGTRDLALLGDRSESLAGVLGAATRDRELTLDEELSSAAEGADPTEVASLSDALDDPGEAPYSPQALARFSLLSAELRQLRAHAGEPLLDLVRRIIDTTGIDVELAASVSPAAQARRENLDLFVKAVAEFQAIDGEVTLSALLAFLEAEDESGGNGLDVATPTDADSVKLLTVHRAKGLEWDAVFLVGVSAGRFPSSTSRTRWIAGPGVLPYPLRGDYRDLPKLAGFAKEQLEEFTQAGRSHEAQEELRLGYVAFTRARHQLVVSSYLWSPTRKTPLGPSPYQTTVRERLTSFGSPPPTWLELPEKGTPNPLHRTPELKPWPVEAHTHEVQRRLTVAALVDAEIARLRGPQQELFDAADLDGLGAAETELVGAWDRELERLLAEAREARADLVTVPLPSSLSATAVARLRDDPAGFAEALARPMPGKPAPAARFGTQFHAWVEQHLGGNHQEMLVDPEDLPGRADAEIDGDADLRELVDRFLAGPFADRGEVTVEPPFALVLAGQVVRGRIDAVFAEPDGGYLVVDWKTNRSHSADPLQLALYRVAWAELSGTPVEKIRAAFYYVRDGEVVEYDDLPDRSGLEALLLTR